MNWKNRVVRVCVLVGALIMVITAVLFAQDFDGRTLPSIPIGSRLVVDGGLLIGTAPRIVAASSSLKCGTDVYKVSTGTATGTCTSVKENDGHVSKVTCTDGAGSSAGASCTGNGIGSCDGTTGTGGCEITAK